MCCDGDAPWLWSMTRVTQGATMLSPRGATYTVFSDNLIQKARASARSQDLLAGAAECASMQVR